MKRCSNRSGNTSPSAIAMAIVVAAFVSWWMVGDLAWNKTETNTAVPHLSDIARKSAAEDSAKPAETKHAVTIRPAPSTPRIVVHSNVAGESQSVSVACSTCHATRLPVVANKQASDLDEFHQGLAFSHNSLSCLSCHNPNDYDTLRLADGTSVEYENVMKLCAQCHGPQTRYYNHGAHGGMTGFWDLTRGPRQRNNCVDCHHPHTPQFPKMKPTFKPRDRFLNDVHEEPTSRTDGQEAIPHE